MVRVSQASQEIEAPEGAVCDDTEPIVFYDEAADSGSAIPDDDNEPDNSPVSSENGRITSFSFTPIRSEQKEHGT